jgi:hypothetical protein
MRPEPGAALVAAAYFYSLVQSAASIEILRPEAGASTASRISKLKSIAAFRANGISGPELAEAFFAHDPREYRGY